VSFGTDEKVDESEERFDREEDLGLTKKAAKFQMFDWMQTRTGWQRAGMALSLVVCAWPSICVFAAPGARNEQPVGAGMVREFAATTEEVRQAVLDQVKDQIIHGTKIFDKEPVLSGAEAVDSTPLFEPWTGAGDVYYKIRKNAIAPRHFLESADQGTIALRFVVIAVNQNRTRVRIDAVYVESAHHTVHISDGTVEKAEMQELKDRLEAAQEAAQEAADAKRRRESAEVVHQTYVRQRDDETSRLSNAQSAEKQLEEEVKSVRHEVERRVKAPGADLKAAPFQSAATLKPLSAYAEVLVLIVTPHWLGVETPEGQRGWIPEERLEQLP
jgi:hypothetical protein